MRLRHERSVGRRRKKKRKKKKKNAKKKKNNNKKLELACAHFPFEPSQPNQYHVESWKKKKRVTPRHRDRMLSVLVFPR